jgi:hypothetical protein
MPLVDFLSNFFVPIFLSSTFFPNWILKLFIITKFFATPPTLLLLTCHKVGKSLTVHRGKILNLWKNIYPCVLNNVLKQVHEIVLEIVLENVLKDVFKNILKNVLINVLKNVLINVLKWFRDSAESYWYQNWEMVFSCLRFNAQCNSCHWPNRSFSLATEMRS